MNELKEPKKTYFRSHPIRISLTAMGSRYKINGVVRAGKVVAKRTRIQGTQFSSFINFAHVMEKMSRFEDSLKSVSERQFYDLNPQKLKQMWHAAMVRSLLKVSAFFNHCFKMNLSRSGLNTSVYLRFYPFFSVESESSLLESSCHRANRLPAVRERR